MTVVLHVAPHPDDESIGSPCTLLRLAERGARVVVVVCGLGRRVDHQRRRGELEAAVHLLGYELVVRQPPAALSSADDLTATQRELVPWLVSLIDDYAADLVVGPHLEDRHPAHETIARVVRDAIPLADCPPVWWAWAIWNELPQPTLLVPVAPRFVEQAVAALSCYRGELDRNNYVNLLTGTRQANAVRGVERVLGFGARQLPGVRYAELLAEFGWIGGGWRRGVRRVDPRPALPTSWDGAEPGFGVPLRHASRLR